MTGSLISAGDIRSAYTAIAPHIRRTPIIEVDGSDFGISTAQLVLKLESLQHAGSFKARGAFTSLLTRKIPGAGVVAEPGGAAALAALTSRQYVPSPDERVGVLICGGNTAVVDFKPRK